MMFDSNAPALWLHTPTGAPLIVNWGQVTRVRERDGETFIYFSAFFDDSIDYEIVRESIDEIYTELTATPPPGTEAPPIPPAPLASGDLPAPMRPGPPPDTAR